MNRILLVDDDLVTLRCYAAGLSRRGFKVDTASDGLTAIQALRTAKPDLIVLDLMMPKLNGVDVLKFVRSNPALANVPVIVLSNSFGEEAAAQAADAGANKGFVKTSCTPSLLAQVVADLLEGRSVENAEHRLLAVVRATREKKPTS